MAEWTSPLCRAAECMLCPPFRSRTVIKRCKWFAFLSVKWRSHHSQIAKDQTDVLLEFKAEEGLQKERKVFVDLFIPSLSLFSPGKDPCQVCLQSSAWGSWELQLECSSRSGALHPPCPRCALLPSALHWTSNPIQGREARIRRTQEEYIVVKICVSKSMLKT